MLLVPDWLSGDDVGRVTDTLREKRRAQSQATTPRLHNEVVPQLGFEMTGKHHEIYRSDFRRVAPERLQTILRQPVIRAAGG